MRKPVAETSGSNNSLDSESAGRSSKILPCLADVVPPPEPRGNYRRNGRKQRDPNRYPAETEFRPQKRVGPLLSSPFQFGPGHRAEKRNRLYGGVELLAHFTFVHARQLESELFVSFICHGGTIQRRM